MEVYLIFTPLGAVEAVYKEGESPVLSGQDEAVKLIEYICSETIAEDGITMPYPPSAEHLSAVLSEKLIVVKEYSDS